MQCICSIYRCSKKEGMYLYVDKKVGLEKIPEPLMRQIGKTELAMTLLIDSEKKLARANAADVLASINEKGFYLQMPPVLQSASEKEMSQMRDKNSKL
jgi:uncharacterized protein YcgL (UPF0745 family)